MGRVDLEKRRAATERLRQLADAGHLTSRHVRLTAAGRGISEHTVWRWIGPHAPPTDGRSRPGYRLTDTDRAAFVFYQGNVGCTPCPRRAVIKGTPAPSGTDLPEEFVQGWR
ncbi:hypothetical protein [Nocardiopsis quinghaiensis]|uniref:hypothetical protein n=1 Tax=Nocardiopsis quinghaiensis TaxID=464995 RepID=UPI001680EF0C|nr:hypothetical protein [Nocardiopsis quinghaiensis]